MRKRTPILAFFVALLLCTSVLLSGCGMVELDMQKDYNQVIAKVDGKEIKKVQFIYSYNQMLNYYSQYGQTFDETTAEGKKGIAELKKSVFDNIIRNEFIKQQSEKGGFNNLSDSDKQEVSDDLDKQIKSEVDNLIEGVKAENPAKSETEIRKLAEDEYFTNMGYTRQQALDELYINKGIEKWKESLAPGIVVTEDDIDKKYKEILAQQKTDFEKEFSKYEEAVNGGSIIAYNLPGYIKVQSLLIAISDEDKVAIEALKKEDANSKKAAEMLTAALKKIEGAANFILNKAKVKDADFSALIAEYGEDPGMADEETRKEGYLVGEKTTQFVSEYTKAALKLKNVGDMTTELVKTDFGYFIIKNIKIVPKLEVAKKDISEKIKDQLLTERKEAKITESIDNLFKKAKVEKFEKRLKINKYSN